MSQNFIYKNGSFILYQEVEDGLVLDHFERYPVDKNEEIYCEGLRGFVINGMMELFQHPPILVCSKRLNIVWDKGKSLTLYDGDIKQENVMYRQIIDTKKIEIIITR